VRAAAAPLFSVIIPTHNRCVLLDRCLRSVAAQTCDEFEIIVVDDGSTDGTATLVAEWARRDARIRYLFQPGRGACAARNLGVAESRGNCVTFIDDDDEVLPGWLECFRTAVEEQAADVVCLGQTVIAADGSVKRTRLPRDADYGVLVERGAFLSGTFALRRDVFLACGGYAAELRANQQSEFKYRLLPMCEQAGWKLVCIAAPLVKHYLHDGPKIRRNIPAVYESGLAVLERHAQLLAGTPRLLAEWCAVCGSCAAKLGRYGEARRLFLQAFRVHHRNWRNLARAAAASCPLLRAWTWRADQPA
jgi:glycosyltransferase involved in cell wall biosynthesis